MKKVITTALAALTLLGGVTVASGASAQRYGYGYGNHRGYDRHYDHRGRNDGAAIALGVLAGAAIVGNGRVYANPGYGYGYGPPRGYYGRHYYPRCWTESRWDPYYGRIHQRVCR